MKKSTKRLLNLINPILAEMYKFKKLEDSDGVLHCQAEIDNIWFDENRRVRSGKRHS